MLDPRLSLAFDLYPECRLAADIGTDHAYLPAALLQRGRCQRMILTDISPSALENARRGIMQSCLSDRVTFALDSGLSPLREPCDAISVTGMGGRTIRQILLSGRDRLMGAVLILSAHTDWPLIREAVMETGYRLDREEPCFDAGRFYLLLRAVPGREELTDQEIRLGKPLFSSASPVLLPFLRRRREVLLCTLNGLRSSVHPDEARNALLLEDLAFYDRKIKELEA
ncbi:MAG: SAM-dependent methyltransferase [Clostridia bacterium]|nr:SAM-dependent methyltransferase [Clostridia bacterium]